MDKKDWTTEAKKKERNARLLAGITICAVIFSLLLVLWQFAGMSGNVEEQRNQPDPEVVPSGTVIPELTESPAEEQYPEELKERLAGIEEKRKMTAHLGDAYELVYEITADSASCIAKKEGKWGMVTIAGDVLVPFEYERVSYVDNTGWVEFQKGTSYAVYDENGNSVRLYENKFSDHLESEEAYLYRTAEANMSGMIVKTVLPENPEQDYYGVEYYCQESGELLYRAIGGADEVGLFTFPDETGRAVAIQNHATSATIYYITEDGCISKEIQLPEGVNYRWFELPGQYSWADIALSEGWLKVDVTDAVPGFLVDDYEYYTAFLNVDTLELVRFPEEYQGNFWVYDMGRGDAIAITSSIENPGGYAVCKGSEKLTGECYYWVVFDALYIMARAEEWVEILDYSGNLKAKYLDAGGQFFHGKMLVYDGTGVYFINEELEKCSEYLLEGRIDRCFSKGVVIDGWYYFIPGFAE